MAQIAYVASIIAAIITTVSFICIYTARMIREFKAVKFSIAYPTDEELEKGIIRTSDAVWHTQRTVFLLTTYIFMLISFSLYVFKYPYTCSSDFRYMTASLVFTSLGFVACQETLGKGIGKPIKTILNLSMAACLIGSLIVYMFWDIA